MTKRIFRWPDVLPAQLEGLFDAVETGSEHAEMIPLADLGDFADRQGTAETFRDEALLIVLDSDAVARGNTLQTLTALIGAARLNTVVVLSDAYLGTDLDDLTEAATAAAVVAAVRSVAIRRGSSGRANVVCVPAAMFGNAAGQRGPLSQKVELVDVVEATCFFLSDDNTYLNGQVLFVNGGRHLFSSLTA